MILRSKPLPHIIRYLQSLSDPDAVAGMARYGIVSKNVLGISVVKLRSIAEEIGKGHRLAQQLWMGGILDARFLAVFIEEPDKVTEAQMERWAKDFDNWAICDGCCLHLFDRIPFAWKKAIAWSSRREEFVRRAAFTLMAVLAVHDKGAHEKKFIRLLPRIKRAAIDERNGVKKAVNWARRQIGKRNLPLNKRAISTAHQIKKMESSSARWIACDALRERTSPAVTNRLKKKGLRVLTPPPIFRGKIFFRIFR